MKFPLWFQDPKLKSVRPNQILSKNHKSKDAASTAKLGSPCPNRSQTAGVSVCSIDPPLLELSDLWRPLGALQAVFLYLLLLAAELRDMRLELKCLLLVYAAKP